MIFYSLPEILLFAQNDGGGGGGGGGNFMSMLLPFLAIGALFYFLLIRPQRREQGRRQAMLATLKKNDRVVTHSGIYGVVTNIQREADEITIKVDESTNTKLRVTLGSIAQVLAESTSADAASRSES